MIGKVYSIRTSDLNEGLNKIEELGLPVEVDATYRGGGGFSIVAKNEEEFRRLFLEGQKASPGGEIRLRWPPDHDVRADDLDDALRHIHERWSYPVGLRAAFDLGGWGETATNDEEFIRMFFEGKEKSPSGEIVLVRYPK